jgi:hypothetical protein
MTNSADRCNIKIMTCYYPEEAAAIEELAKKSDKGQSTYVREIMRKHLIEVGALPNPFADAGEIRQAINRRANELRAQSKPRKVKPSQMVTA